MSIKVHINMFLMSKQICRQKKIDIKNSLLSTTFGRQKACNVKKFVISTILIAFDINISLSSKGDWILFFFNSKQAWLIAESTLILV